MNGILINKGDKLYEYRVWFHKEGGDICLRVKNVACKHVSITDMIEMMMKKLEDKIGQREKTICIVYEDSEGIWWEANALDPYEQRSRDAIRDVETSQGINPFERSNMVILKL